MAITINACWEDISKSITDLTCFVTSLGSLFLMYKTPKTKITLFVIRNGYAQTPNSNGLIPVRSSDPPIVLNNKAGNTTGIKVTITTAIVTKNISSEDMLCLTSDVLFSNFSPIDCSNYTPISSKHIARMCKISVMSKKQDWCLIEFCFIIY